MGLMVQAMPPRRSGARRAAGLFAATIALALGCAVEDSGPRAGWLRHTLIIDNQPFLDREPELTKGKFAIMADDLYRFVRGTAGQYARDVMMPGGAGRMPSDYESAKTRTVAITGDPHPENIGTYRRADGEVTLNYNDFDGATFGPYTYDLRRLALGLWFAGIRANLELEELGGATAFSDDVKADAVRAAVRGYVDEIERAERGEPALEVTKDRSFGAIAGEFLERATERGGERDRLRTYSRAESARRLTIGNVEPPREIEIGDHTHAVWEDTVEEISDVEAERVRGMLAGYAASLEDESAAAFVARAEILGIGRRLGAGVSSYPNRRYYVLLGERGGADPADAVLLDWKEVIDATELPGLEIFPSHPYTTNAERIVSQRRDLQGSPQVPAHDVWLGVAASGADSFRVAERSGYQRGFSVDRLARDIDEGDVVPADFTAYARLAGMLLARSHGAAPGLGREPSGPAIAEAIGGDRAGLAEETLRFVEQYAPVVLRDFELFREAVADHGFDLGYRSP